NGRALKDHRELSAGPAAALAELGISPNKLRGQNFLVQKTFAARIADLAKLSANDSVLEIGPGLGILSEQIIRAGPRRVRLVELDSALADRLRAKLRGVTSVEVVAADFLELELIDLEKRPP